MRGKKFLTNNKGFTLVEIAIVLIIIGLILGAAIKGKDLIQSAKQKKFYTNYVKAWELSALAYYDRTGNVLGDGTINGGTVATSNGLFDNINGANFDAANGIDATLKKVGLTVPTSNTAESGQYSYKGQVSGTVTLTLSLYYLPSATDGRSSNAIYLTNVPTDLALSLDTIVDGAIDATAGTFRRYADDQGQAWPDVTTTPTVNTMYILDIP